MGGALLNIVTVTLGSLLGMAIGQRLPARLQESVVTGLGLITLLVGLQNASRSGNIIITLLAILIGVIIGEALRLDLALERFGAWLQRRFAARGPEDQSVQQRERFLQGFITASLVFCVGPLTFVGSIQDGMGLAIGFQAIAIKSALDAFASLAFAASFGVGVLFSVVTIALVQGGLSLLGMVIVGAASVDSASLSSSPIILELTAAGGIMLMALALVLLDIKKPRVANFLPALLVAPALVALGQALGITLYPF